MRSSRRQSHFDFVYERGCTALDASMCAEGAHFDTRSARSVFCDAQVAAENLLKLFFACGQKTLRGFVYSLSSMALPAPLRSNTEAFVQVYHNLVVDIFGSIWYILIAGFEPNGGASIGKNTGV